MPQLPTNVKLFIEQVIGKSDPVTETDFTPEEIAYITRQVAIKRKQLVEQEQMLNHLLSTYTNAPPHDSPLMEKGRNDAIADYTRQIEALQSKRSATPITYDDYPAVEAGWPSEQAYVDSERGQLGYVDALRASLASPGYRVKTSLGQYVARDSPVGGVTVEDAYNWNRPSRPITAEMMARSIPSMIQEPEALGNVLMRLLAPSRSRDVRLKLNALSPEQRNSMVSP
jgi:hypothetical protein